ncbi:MAG: DUF2846 domain-containing protein [Gallionella sp.]|nr:DUF2846 domain-containing protein [Gallionella sp.]
MFKRILLLALMTLSLVGCASVQMADPAKDAQAKQFTAKPDVAGIYIYRNESMGAALKMDIDLDGKPLGQSAAKTYFYAEVQPGNHKITSKTENTVDLSIDAVAGKLYYVWQEVKMGVWSARSKLQLVDEATGQAGVNECKLAAPLQ